MKLKMRKRKGWAYCGNIAVVHEGKTIKKFRTLVSARQFANVMHRLRYTDEQWEAYERHMVWLQGMREDSTT